jgi:hypothetical protein
MANIIIRPFDETPGERSLRQKKKSQTQRGIIESGTQMYLSLFRTDPKKAFEMVMRALHGAKNACADQGWDDEKVVVVIGVQMRNKWEIDVDGEPIEVGSVQWLDRQAAKAKGRL